MRPIAALRARLALDAPRRAADSRRRSAGMASAQAEAIPRPRDPKALATSAAWAAWAVLCALALLLAAGAAAAEDLLPQLREEILTIKKPGLFDIDLEATLYRPAGDGPFPLVIINHGKALGNPRFQARARYPSAARELVQRGYAVVIPMRQGFSKSGGSYIAGGCNVESNGRVQAADVVATLKQMSQRADIDARRVVVFGQSHGGLTTMAFGSLGLPNVAGLVNFAGGLRQKNCTAWESGLAAAMGSYAKSTSVPSLWFYGDNDSYFAPPVWRDMHARYVANGGHARLVAYGRFGVDSHQLFGSTNGVAVWLPEVEAFFRELGLPFEQKQRIALALHADAVPSETGFAALDDAAALPNASAAGRDGYAAYLRAEAPKAFALGTAGTWAWRTGSRSIAQALENCAARAKDHACKLYAVDAHVVWSAE